jgi:ribosome-associated toxin RatA of RatAB toxin-antitoxin module
MIRLFAPVAGISLALAVAGPAGAASRDPVGARVAEGRAADAPKVESLPVRGSSLQRVRATVAVSAPVERVRAVVFDFARYPEFMPGYKQAGVIRTTPSGGGLVQLVIEQLGGMVQLRMRVEISPPQIAGAVEAYDGRLVQGNVKAFETRWELEPLGPRRTRLTVESFLDPDLPLVPSSAVNDGAREGLRDAVLALKARSEGRAAAH